MMKRSSPSECIIDLPSPFDLSTESPYQIWRDEKLHEYPARAEDLIVPIADWSAPSLEERRAIFDLCAKTNMAIYRVDEALDKQSALNLACLFGLNGLDLPLFTQEQGMTEIKNLQAGRQGEYAPYTARALSWHTDGYYNAPEQQVLGMVLHCARAADDGGMSFLLDSEIAYIRLRDENPKFVLALMDPEALTIPENIENGVCVRTAQTGPVFSVLGGYLHMRYTARKRYVEWKPGRILNQACQFLTALLEDPEGPVLKHRMTAGEGLITNNVLHNRSAFNDGANGERLLYRARFKSRVSDNHPPKTTGAADDA